MQIDGILFDFDGTLFDTISLIVESYQYAYRKHNKREHSEEEIKAGIGLPLETIFNNEYPEDSADLLKTYLEHNNHHTATGYGIFLGIGPMLDGLCELNVPLGIVTAKRYNNAIVTLETSGYKDYFSAIVTKYDTEIHKPNPEPLFLGMKKLGLSDPTRIMYVGDSVFDIQAANNGNFISVAVDWTQIDPELLRAESPDFWLDHPLDLVELVKKSNYLNN